MTGPVAGYISGGFGYPAIFLSAALAVLVGFGIATGLYRHAAAGSGRCWKYIANSY